MRVFSIVCGATVTLGATLAACSDGSNLLGNGGAAGMSTTDPAGSSTGATAGSSVVPTTGGDSPSTSTAGTTALPVAGSSGTTTGGAQTGSGGGGGPVVTGGGGAGGSGGGAPIAGTDAGGSGGAGGAPPVTAGPFKVLVISTALEFPHDSIGECQKMVADLGKLDPNNSWTTKVEGDDLADFTAAGLKDYGLIFSCNPTGRVFSGNPKLVDKAGAMKAFQDFIETDGKGFAGVHSASDFEKTNGFPWFTNTLMGAYFVSHDNDGTSGSVVSDSQNAKHVALTGLAGTFSTKDEWYKMNRDPGSQPGFKILQRLASDSRPLTWVKDVGAGRMFYTARGHAKYTFTEEPFRNVVKNGILWATKRLN
jgi:type 1 glutamine amidotransferase